MLHNPSKHSEGQYDEVSTFHRWVEFCPGQIHGVTHVTKGDRYSSVHFISENLHSRMSLESLDTLRQQGFPLNSTEFGLLANMDIEAHGRGKEVLMMEGQVWADSDRSVSTPNRGRAERELNAQPDRPDSDVLHDRCVQGGIPKIQNVVVESFETDAYLKPGMTDTRTHDTGWGVSTPNRGRALPEGPWEGGWKSEQWGWEAQKVDVDSDAVADVADYNNTAVQTKITESVLPTLPGPEWFPEAHWLKEILPMCCAMVTFSLSPKDPRFTGQDAREALRKELDGLVKQGVWQWDDCADLSEIKKRHPEHHAPR
eukprot:6416716-Amphidinium_carterae.1